MNWTQPICAKCWYMRNPDREASRLLEPEVERCCHCGESTNDGIYVRIDPRTVAHPSS